MYFYLKFLNRFWGIFAKGLDFGKLSLVLGKSRWACVGSFWGGMGWLVMMGGCIE